MPQLIAIALIGGVAWFAWRAFKREMARVGDELRNQETVNKERDVTSLEAGEDGVYRPTKIESDTRANDD